MLALQPRLVSANVDEVDEGRACYCVVVSCVSLLLFVVLAAAVSIAKAGAITGAVVLLLGLIGWLAPAGTTAGRRAARRTVPTAPGAVRRRCACGLSDAAIGALPTFAYQPPTAAAPTNKGGVMCAVCLEDVQAGEMVRQLLPACTHLFHADCVDAWLRTHRTCPLCRRDLSPRNNKAADDLLPPV